MNEKYEKIRIKLHKMCNEEDIKAIDFIKYYIFSEYPIEIINETDGTIDKIDESLKEDYEFLWDAQPRIEENEELAFAIQHTRDLIDILLGRNLLF